MQFVYIVGGGGMIRETYLAKLKGAKIPSSSCIVVCRGRGNDELAPSEELLKNFLLLKKGHEEVLGKGSAEAHNKAFEECQYKKKFIDEIQNNPKAVSRLEEIRRRAIREDVWLVCYEGDQKMCHRHILLDLIKEKNGQQ